MLAAVDQQYLLQARQMQALSFSVHIPLVCFGIAFPVMVLFVEWLYPRTGDQLYLTLARRPPLREAERPRCAVTYFSSFIADCTI